MEHRELFALADAAGRKAAEAKTPRAMIVSGGGQEYYVAEGVCGFAWVNVHPGNSAFARYLKKAHGCRKAYGGGIGLWISAYGQSMERKEAYAHAFAETLRANGVKAYAGSRMD